MAAVSEREAPRHAGAVTDRLAIIHQGALGDFLLALPVFEGLHRRYPHTSMDFCSRLEHLSLLETKPYFGEAHSSDTSVLAALYHDDLWRSARMPAYLLEASSIFLFGQPRSRILADRFSQLMGRPVYWIQSFPSPGHRPHEPVTRYLLAQLREQGLAVDCVLPEIEVPGVETLEVRSWVRSAGWEGRPKPVIIHPGSGGRKKIWPLKDWWALLEWLRAEYNRPLLMVLGPADRHLEPFAAAAQRLGVRMLEDLSLQRLAAFLSESALYIGNDSGVSHLAAATGIPIIAIFGPTRPEIWAPRGAKVHLIRSEWDEQQNLNWPVDTRTVAVNADVGHVVAAVLNGGC